VYGSEPDGCARFSSRIHGSLRTVLNNPIAERRKTMAVQAAHDYHRERNNQRLDNRLIAGTPATDLASRVRRRPRLGGLLNFYARAA
jgi:hypothetical protein